MKHDLSDIRYLCEAYCQHPYDGERFFKMYLERLLQIEWSRHNAFKIAQATFLGMAPESGDGG